MRKYYLVIFIDEYSRYVVHHELMCYLDGDTLSQEAQRAIETVSETSRLPEIQSDNGSGYISGEFKQVLTEHKLRQYLRRCHAAWSGMGHYLDCLIASDGVWMAYESQKIGMQRLDRTGKLSSLQNEGSQEGVSYTFDGRSYMGYTSTLVESGTLYGIKKGGQNWKKYVPPSPAGVTKNAQTEQYVPFEFVAGAIPGTGSNQLPIYLSNASATGMTPSLVTEGSQMPGRVRMQVVPDVPNMMILDGLTEDRIYSDTA